jgi:trimeric autotransporter adhesin
MQTHWIPMGALAAVVVAGGCGGSNGTTGPGGAGALSVIVVTPDTASIAIGGTQNFTATGKDAQGRAVTGLSFFWSSNTASLATVTQGGVVTGAAVGTLQIAASAQGKSGLATVIVTAKPVGSIVVTPAHATIRVATTLQLSDTVKDASGAVLSGQPVTWSSDSSSTVSVDGNGLVTGRQIGTATITASAGGKSAHAAIIVSQVPVKSITIAPLAPAVSVGQTTQLTATTFDSAGNQLPGRVVRWKSGNVGVASVDSIAGIVTGVSPGTAGITATSETITKTVTATVSAAPVNSVVLSPSVAQLNVGRSQTFTATVTDVNGNPVSGATVTFTSNATGIASVTSSTPMTAQVLAGPGAGTATITGTSGAKSGTATMIVSLVPVDSVHVAAAHTSLTVGHQDTATATAFDSTGAVLTGRPVTWGSSNNSVATVVNGIVTTLQPGTVVIFATVSGVTGSVTLTINPVPVGSVTVSPSADTLQPSGSLQLTVVVRDSVGNVIPSPAVTWTPLNPGIATVTSTGLVSALAAGTAKIRVSDGGKADTNTTVVVATVSTVDVFPTLDTLFATAPGNAIQLVDSAFDASHNYLPGQPVTWSQVGGFVTVSASGLVTAAASAPGTSTVTAASSAGPSGNSTIVVQGHSQSVAVVGPASDTLSFGNTGFPVSTTVSATVSDTFGGDVSSTRMVTWTSPDPSILTVNGGTSATVTAATPVTLAAAASATGSSITVGVSTKDNGTANSVSLTVNP